MTSKPDEGLVRGHLLALEDFINEPQRGRDESPELRDYRHDAYHKLTPVIHDCFALFTRITTLEAENASLRVALDASVGALIGANVIIDAISGRPSIAIETAIERGNAALSTQGTTDKGDAS